ncbi:MAG: molybdopterin converting factor [Chloroflexi bacterium]|nr:molybdopterin converting factor [Chloroflexota bacterium]
MELEIRLFATLKDRAGKNHIRVQVSEPATVQTVLDTIVATYPQLKTSLETTLVSVNKSFSFPEQAISSTDEIALFPPVSGGSDTYPYPTYFAITPDPFDLQAIQQQLTQPDVGAIVSFTGSVRGSTNRDGYPAETIHLEYEAYEEMATIKMAQIAQEIWERWPTVKGVAIVQRIGKLTIGDHTTLVACASGHRDQGVFEATRYGIDRLKEIVPVWKKEVGPDNATWVEGTYHPTHKDNK